MQDIKVKYLAESNYEDSTKEVIISFFDKVETVENDLNKNVFDFNEDDIITLFNQFPNSKQRLKVLCTYLTSYYEWCVRHGFTNISNPYEDNKVFPIIDNIE